MSSTSTAFCLPFNDVIQSVKALWSKQSQLIKYCTIAVIAFPSCILLRNLYWMIYRKMNSLPPGPNGLPFIGPLTSWLSSTSSRIALCQKYGPICYTEFFGRPTIIISSSEKIKEVLTRKEFLYRNKFADPTKDYYHSFLSTGNCYNTWPLALANSDNWEKRRKLAKDAFFNTLNTENAGNLLKESMDKEFKPYLDDIITSNKPWLPREILNYITLNTIYATLCNKNIDRNSKLFTNIERVSIDFFNLGLLDVLVRKIPGFKYIFAKKLDESRDLRHETLMEIVNDKINDKNDAEKTSYIDYTREKVINGELTQDEESADMMGLFVDGMDTMACTLEFIIVLFAKYIDIQQKVRKELINIMGNEYNLKLVNKCPLFRAAIYETLRISSVVYQGVAHTSYNDYWIEMDDGKTRYKIPKNCNVIPNVDYIHIYGGINENWVRTNGDEIILDNFLTQDDDDVNGVKRFIINKSFIGFGVGKRDCIGRQLAIKEINYVIGYLLINYKISFVNKEDTKKDITTMRSANGIICSIYPSIPIKVEKM